jgi:hypothetical protein
LAPIIIADLPASSNWLRKDGVTVFLVRQNANQALKLADHVAMYWRMAESLCRQRLPLLNDPKGARDAYLGGLAPWRKPLFGAVLTAVKKGLYGRPIHRGTSITP